MTKYGQKRSKAMAGDSNKQKNDSPSNEGDKTVLRATEGLIRLERLRQRKTFLRWIVVAILSIIFFVFAYQAIVAASGRDPMDMVWKLIQSKIPK